MDRNYWIDIHFKCHEWHEWTRITFKK